ncbi:TIGR03842 family LLM class F420-dependent oxidoreductase [Ktedonospora formicarum]|uniref:LLM class F420-dependent oxidoreductase n=1 Tax=Ktedonospora formicarum TaxID=2778364 RepID=A0A8J3IEY0_9CHLR|nr:TIGR03842 family LLM class F420-dependent oxidoreductase [Ktedonospora formicarum]GHO51123.1 LLM class F420-dependent oxidoreductase [Ktedonospora formicarum]
MIEFGITLKPDPPSSSIVALTRKAEEQGFSYAWLFDSHLLWMEPFSLLTLMATNTSRIRLGTCVTNPCTREASVIASAFATLQEISGGRMLMGIGRGDSAVRVLGKKPASLATMEQATHEIRSLVSGEMIHGTLQIKWAHGNMPIFVAAYGPQALRLAGRIGDGVILQFADPHLIQWSLQFVRQGCEEAGRDWSRFQVMCAAASYVSDDLECARAQVRWFPALVSNHVLDLISRYSIENLPPELTSYVRNRPTYDYQQHCQVGALHVDFVPDEVIDRFCVIGTAQQCQQRIEELANLGVTQFNIYLMTKDKERTLDAYGKEIIPAFSYTQY